MSVLETNNLGKYLGVSLLRSRVTRKTYQYIIDNIKKKLTALGMRKLSLASRITLALSVISAIPTYAMQTSIMPNYICEVVDKLCRQFIWGSLEGVRKVPLVPWKQVMKPKEYGGLGFRSAKSTNQAYMMKMAWELLTNEHAMWVKILKAKYKFKCEHPTFLLHKPNCSNLWKGICSIWNDVRKGIVWSLSNGNSISFWLDAWLPDGQILPQQITLSLNESLLTRTVSSYICENGQWDWEVLGGHFQMSTLLKIANVPAPSSRGISGLPCLEADK